MKNIHSTVLRYFLPLLALLAIVFPAAVCLAEEGDKADVKEEDVVCATDFEKPDEDGLYDLLQKNKYLQVVDDEGVDGSKAIKATYEGFAQGSQRVAAMYKLPRRLKEASLVFDVKFDRSFQFVRGGKLHGFAPDNAITGGQKMVPGGWSARAMWGKKGLFTYVYSQNKEGKYGQGPDYQYEFDFPKGRYYSVTIYMKLNDPVDQANGMVAIFVNRTCVSYKHDIQFRSEEGAHTEISQFLFNTFHGGSDPSWAPKDKNGDYTSVYAYFDNITIYDGLYVRHSPGEKALAR